MAKAGEDAADVGIIVRRALAGEIGQEGDADVGALRSSPSSRGQVGGRLAGRSPECQFSASVADRMTPIWCQVLGSAWQKACTALSGFGR